mgnify:FL=1
MKLKYTKKRLGLMHVIGLIIISLGLHSSINAQIVSYQKIATFSIDSLNSIVLSAGLPPGP